MIIKIRKARHKMKFAMYDNARHVTFGYGGDSDVAVKLNKEGGGYTMHFPDGKACEVNPDVMVVDPEQLEASDCFHWIRFLDSVDGDEKLIVFNTEGFILNDSGKTLEIIR